MTTTPLFDKESPSEILYNYPDTISIPNVPKLVRKGYRIDLEIIWWGTWRSFRILCGWLAGSTEAQEMGECGVEYDPYTSPCVEGQVLPLVLNG